MNAEKLPGNTETSTKSKLSLSGRDIRFLLLEGVVVLIGVVLALMVDEWREERDNQRQANEIMAQLNAEIATNLVELEASFATVSERLEVLHAIRDEVDGSEMFLAYLPRFQGYNTPDLNRSAWERAVSLTVVGRLPAEYMRDAFVIYRGNGDIVGLDGDINRLIYSENFYLPEKAFVAWAISERIMQQQVGWLHLAIQRHRIFLEQFAPGQSDQVITSE